MPELYERETVGEPTEPCKSSVGYCDEVGHCWHACAEWQWEIDPYGGEGWFRKNSYDRCCKCGQAEC